MSCVIHWRYDFVIFFCECGEAVELSGLTRSLSPIQRVKFAPQVHFNIYCILFIGFNYWVYHYFSQFWYVFVCFFICIQRDTLDLSLWMCDTKKYGTAISKLLEYTSSLSFAYLLVNRQCQICVITLSMSCINFYPRKLFK